MIKRQVIIFEGPDDVGKSTLSENLQLAFNKMNIPCQSESFPGKTKNSIGELVYRIHHNAPKEGISEISDTALQALHIAAHIDFLERISNKNKSLLLLDRCWWSTIVYGQLSKANSKVINSLINAELLLWKNLNIIVVLVSGRNTSKSLKTKKLSNEYRKLARTEKNKYPVICFKNVAPIEKSGKRLMKLLMPYLKSYNT